MILHYGEPGFAGDPVGAEPDPVVANREQSTRRSITTETQFGLASRGVPQDVVERQFGDGKAGARELGRGLRGVEGRAEAGAEASAEAALKTVGRHFKSRGEPEAHGGIGVELAAQVANRIEAALDGALDLGDALLQFGRHVHGEEIEREAGRGEAAGHVVMKNSGEALAFGTPRLEKQTED